MSKQIALVPFDKIEKIELYINKSRKTMKRIKSETNCDYIVNAGIFSGSKALCNVKSNGKIINNPKWSEFGYAWNDVNDFKMEIIPNNKNNYLGCVAIKRYDGDKSVNYPKDMGGKRGRSAIGVAGRSLLLYCSSDDSKYGSTPESLKSELEKTYKVDTALMLDGGGSSQCIFPNGSIYSSRIVNNFILIYLKKAIGGDKMSKKVVLDAGHGTQSNNKSPDGSFSEPEFALDMANRMKTILERHGVSVTLTRTGESNPTGKGNTNDLSYRCKVANNIKDLSLFVSLHTNASGTGWSDASGWSVYTSSAGVTAGRNIAANKIIARIKEAGITTRAVALVHERLYVLRNTNAPAILIEHAFHTNKNDVALLKSSEYRNKLAIAQCRGILDYLGIKYDNKDVITTPPANNSSATEVDDWAKESWDKAVNAGIFDGTNPKDAMTREMLAVVLDRLNLIKG